MQEVFFTSPGSASKPLLGAAFQCCWVAGLVTIGSFAVAEELPSQNSGVPSPKHVSRQAKESLRDSEPRSIAEIHRELRRLERETARTESDRERVENILSLCRLFVEIGQHPEITDSPTLQSLSVRLRTRLRGIERRTITELRRRGIDQPENLKSLPSKQRQTTAMAESVANHAGPNRQHDAAAVRQGVHFSAHGDDSQNVHSDESGLPASFGRGHAAPGPDFGWSLVNLIQQTIQPDYWSVAGGPGKALYFGHSRALVIHGSWRVHEDVADLLAALRGY
ncbi:MAG: hypothetical protein NXI32_20985 [bacterium]|nr:hypothetical protein [bacterium]